MDELKDKSTENVLYVKAGAGCYLGESPGQEEGEFQKSLCNFVDERGFAFPILGGISYQTVGVFMLTGSAGGSLEYGFGDVITEITFVNGNAEECAYVDGEDMFYAVGVSMGLLGVITSVTFRLDKKYFVEGKEVNVEFEKSFLSEKSEFKKNS